MILASNRNFDYADLLSFYPIFFVVLLFIVSAF